MALLHQIDRDMPLMLTGLRHGVITDPGMVRWAAERNQPELLNLAEEVPGAPTIHIEGPDVRAMLDFIERTCWRAEFEPNLQSLQDDADGRPMLTTWISMGTFQVFAGVSPGGMCLDQATPHVDKTRLADLLARLQAQTKDWRALGVQEVDLDGYKLEARHGA